MLESLTKHSGMSFPILHANLGEKKDLYEDKLVFLGLKVQAHKSDRCLPHIHSNRMTALTTYEKEVRQLIQTLQIAKDRVKILLRIHAFNKKYTQLEDEIYKKSSVDAIFYELITDYYYYAGEALRSLTDAETKRYGSSLLASEGP